ncbi:MAG: hypothetical protein V4451_04545 [Pseudomonadota bacterium]
MATKKPEKLRGIDPRSITIEQLTFIFSKYCNKKPKKSASDLPTAPYKVEDVPPTSPSEVSHFRSYFKNPDRMEGVITFRMPEALRNRGRKGAKGKNDKK